MKKYLLFIAIFYGNFTFAQLNETFITNTAAWTGSNSGNDFVIVDEQLRSNSITASSNFYLSVANSLANNCQWEFWVNLQFNPSGLNYVDVYLTSNQPNLQTTTPINGYFVRIGNTNDEICLYKRSGAASSSSILIDGVDGILNTSNNKIKIRVTRTSDNIFTLERDITGSGTSYFTEGTVKDASHTTSSYFGFFIQQSTASFHQKHFFDDIKISPIITDTSPPELLSVLVKDSTTLEITFNEPVDSLSAKATANYILNNNHGNPILVKATPDPSKYVLTLAKGLSTASYTVSVFNIADYAGNIVSTNNKVQFAYVKPFIAKKGDLVINEIFADPSPQIDLPSVEYVELFNASAQTIQLKNWKYSDPVSTATLTDSIKAGEYLILCAKGDTNEFKQFGKTLGISPWPSLNNSSDIIKLISTEGITIDSVAYSDSWHATSLKKQGGWSLERIDYASVCQGLFNWASSIDVSGGTPGKQNSVFTDNYDQLAFKADSIKKLSDSTLSVYFNKPADVLTANNAFSLSPTSGNIKSALLDAYKKQVTLLFSERFAPNTSYKISINQLKDCAGNTITPNSFNFTTPKLPPVRLDTAKIRITEIFADPSPEIKLPLVEFVEIYNPGRDTIDLEGWTLHNSKTKSTFKKSLILPNEYLILCPVADTTQYQNYGKVIGLSSWPALTNTADQISLKSFKERLVDSIAYSDSWHTNSAKKQGGWSLERVDYASVCKGLFNWSSSVDVTGGTPGKQNSTFIVNYDQLSFKADSMRKLSDSTLVVYFNKPADVSSSSNAFTLTPASGNIKSVTTDNVSKQVRLLFNNKFAGGTTYTLSLSELKDCAGNTIVSNSFEFTTPKLPPVRLDTAKIHITEIFADPSPEVKLPLIEFIEIYNPGRDTIDLEGWTLHNSKTKSTFKKSLILPNEYLILCPIADTTQYLAYGKVIGLSSWPALTNTADQVSLKSFKERLVDSVSYFDSWHTSSAKKQGGWSLERIDYASVCKGLFNWTSSIDIAGGTPGRQNSVFTQNYDRLAFKADSIKRQSDSTLVVFFNKPADLSSSSNSFTLSPASGNIKSVIADNGSKQVRLLFSDKFKADITYSLSLNQVKDCAGNLASPNTLQFTTPKLPPVRLDTAKIRITEIFADPSPEVKLPLVEFVEIYNQGRDTIDLDGWTINDPTAKATIKKASILPQQYIILCPAQDTLHYKPFGKTIGLSPWPSLNNASDQIFLKSFTGRSSDSVAYQDSWYKDALKKPGGWSLEIIDLQSICTGSHNWIASNDSSGGTPGRQNSVYKLNSTIPLKILQATIQDSTTLSVLFNKPPDSLSASKPNNYNINNGVGSPSAISFSKTLTEVQLHFSGPVARGNAYRVSTAGITDCSGAIITPANSFAECYYPHKITKNSILINEVLFNPRAGGVDFVEIYNNSRNALDLKELSIATIKSPDSIISRKNLSAATLLFQPKSYLVLTTNPDNIRKEYYTENKDAFLTMASMPAFNNDAGTVVLLSAGNRIDQLNYTEKMHFALIKDPKGISLERINFDAPTNENGTFRSAAASSGYATPGYKNSQSVEPLEVMNKEVSLLSETFSPDNDGFEDYLQINYRFKEAGMVANVNVYNDMGLLIKRLAKNTTLASEGALIWDGMNDKEQRASLGIYIVYFEAFDLKGTVLKYKKACVLAAKFN